MSVQGATVYMFSVRKENRRPLAENVLTLVSVRPTFLNRPIRLYVIQDEGGVPV